MDSNSKLKWILISTVILCVLLAFFLLICLLRDRWDNTAAIDDSEGEMRLTTEETFGLFFGGSSVAYLHLFSRASPQSLKLLRDFMRRGDLGRFSTINGIFLMAYLGSSEDQQWLMETYFHGFRGQLDENERDLAFALFDAFGEFHRRGVKNSPVYFEQFTSVDYWEAEDFRLFPPRPTTGVPVPLATATVALRAYASFERLEEVISKGQEILTEISDGRLRNYMENQIGENALKGRSRIKSELEEQVIGEEEHFTLIQSYNEHCGKFGLEPVAAKSTDMLVVDEQEVDHGLTISVDTLNVEYMKLQDSLTEEEMRSRRGKIAQESFHQYKEFEYLAAEKGLEGVLGNLLDRSAPITERYEAKKLEAIRPELEENFQLSAQAVKALRKRDLVPVQFSMKWQLNLERVSKPVTSLENAISEGEEIHVRFVLHKSDDIGREYLGGQIGKVPTVMDDGTLVVHLLAIGGSWYWRPFGW